MQSTTDEMISLDLIGIHVKVLQGENGILKYGQLPNSVIPVDPSIIPISHIPRCIPGTCKFLPVQLFYNSMILPSYRLLSQKPPHHFFSCRSTIPPDEYFWNLIYFCKTRQNWNIPRATNNGMNIVSSLPSTESCVCLRAKLDRKTQNCINNLKANYYSSHLPSFKASQPRKYKTLNTQFGVHSIKQI